MLRTGCGAGWLLGLSSALERAEERAAAALPIPALGAAGESRVRLPVNAMAAGVGTATGRVPGSTGRGKGGEKRGRRRVRAQCGGESEGCVERVLQRGSAGRAEPELPGGSACPGAPPAAAPRGAAAGAGLVSGGWWPLEDGADRPAAGLSLRPRSAGRRCLRGAAAGDRAAGGSEHRPRGRPRAATLVPAVRVPSCGRAAGATGDMRQPQPYRGVTGKMRGEGSPGAGLPLCLNEFLPSAKRV